MSPKLEQVQFINAPVPLMLEANQHQQELMREFALIQLSDDSAKQDVPGRLLEVVAGPAALEMRMTLAEADGFCRRGELLTLATPPECVVFREWFLGEIVRQLDGNPPTPWRD